MKAGDILRGAAAVLAALIATAGPGAAQTCHALTGAWRLDPAKSRLGSGLSFNPALRIDAIDLDLKLTPQGVAQSWRFKGPHVNETDAYLTPTTAVTTPTGLKSGLNFVPAAVKGHWENCTLVEDGQAFLFGQSLWTRSTFEISPDDQRLTIHQLSLSDLGDTERDLVFDRLSTKDAR